MHSNTNFNVAILITYSRFLLAQLHMDSLASKPNVRKIRDALGSLPTTVNSTYSETMARIESQSEEQVSLARSTLSWVTCAMRSLSLRELQCALAVVPDDTEFLEDGVTEIDVTLSVCCGLVTVDTKSHLVRLIRKYSCHSQKRFTSLNTSAARLHCTRLL